MNKVLLRCEMVKKGYSVEQMASLLGISRSAFWKKCNGISEFKQSEIKRMIDLLQPENPTAIFLRRKCLKGNKGEAPHVTERGRSEVN